MITISNLFLKKSLHVTIITPLNLSQIIDVNMEGNNDDDASQNNQADLTELYS